ncbi:unnamed protein product [Hermetia illucens]|uniref:Uncharacterized protein n=1 Tax=Hermetia illucens TaxID=343691 RepID=A0A7R8UJN4_HERIL|nr:unnamed protein product [Hermetia illucens]
MAEGTANDQSNIASSESSPPPSIPEEFKKLFSNSDDSDVDPDFDFETEKDCNSSSDNGDFEKEKDHNLSADNCDISSQPKKIKRKQATKNTIRNN